MIEVGILMGLLGLGLLFGLEGDNGADEPKTGGETPPDPSEGFADNGQTTLIGTDGDDTFDQSSFNANDIFTVLGGEGDDHITYDPNYREAGREPAGFAEIYGQNGDDQIDMVGYSTNTSTAFGGEGSDTLIGNHGSVLQGDAGDDVLVLDGQLEGAAFGGDGNDTLSGSQDNHFYGEDGDDVINVTHQNL
ncbi:hypothetical protein [Sulfitobacter guttiformis]|uniref:Hemolysin type calcium-binding protein n=1 Tax=Sulfitobacter guttiformis TaxID=74349 RepID=A0A420DQP1_9RHOB|nr:hypothetical protein [Sulfitobacter guttiformis]KIN73866.1 hypothetical protein Z949_3059 [Sulfitobacter guttiformis KCTC 32187]RKE96498.1 hemolysin type calcium-binding protein [Sulfitobacter guttiformis]